MKVTQYMTDKVISAHPEAGVRETFFQMREHEIHHMPVVDENKHLLGIISDRDLRRPDWVDEAPDISHAYQLEDHITVKDLMSSNVVVVHTYDKLSKATRLLLEHHFGALPVLNKDEQLAGMLSANDLLQALDDLLHEQHHANKQHKKH